MLSRFLLASAAVCTIGARAAAQAGPPPAGTPPGKAIPIRTVETLASTDSGVVANVYIMHVMSGNRVLLNDATKRRLILFDSTLKTFRILADTAGQGKQSFGNTANGLPYSGGLLRFPGDSVAWVDRGAQALIVVNGSGDIGRVMAPLKPTDMTFFAGSIYGVPGFDVKGRLYFRASRPSINPPRPTSAQAETTYVTVDSAVIVRSDFDERRTDTIATIRIAAQRQRVIQAATCGSFSSVLNPLPLTDEWAYFPDGAVAIIRGHDYHVDWFLPDGSRKSTPKMAFDWRRVTDEEKHRIVDSVRHMIDSLTAARLAAAAATAAATGVPVAPRPPASFSACGIGGQEIMKPEELPDYYPPVRAASQVRVDLDGNMWVLPSTSLQAKGGSLFDVINRDGEIIERVQLPAGRNLHGFGPGGIVYMSIPLVMEAQFGYPRIEKARIIRGAQAP